VQGLDVLRLERLPPAAYASRLRTLQWTPAMPTRHDPTSLEGRARRILADVAFCLAKVTGKYTGYPDVDSSVFERVRGALEQGFFDGSSTARLGDACQELRGVTACPLPELLSFPGADETDLRIAAILETVRARAKVPDDLFRELLTAHLSWEPGDKRVIVGALTTVIRGM